MSTEIVNVTLRYSRVVLVEDGRPVLEMVIEAVARQPLDAGELAASNAARAELAGLLRGTADFLDAQKGQV